MKSPTALVLALSVGLASAASGEPGSPSLVRSIDLRDIPAGQGGGVGTNMGTYPGGFARVGDRVVFGAAVPEGYRELFVMSGPDQASLQQINLDPRAGLDSWPCQSVSAGDLAYVRVNRWDVEGGWEIWRTDGSLLGSYPVAQFAGEGFDTSSTSFEMVPRGNSLFFIPKFGAAASKIMRTDGTPASMRGIAPPPGEQTAVGSALTAWNGGLAFWGSGSQLFLHDPAADATRGVTAGGQPLIADSSAFGGVKIAPAGDGLVAFARIGNNRALWSVPADGSDAFPLISTGTVEYSAVFTTSSGVTFAFYRPTFENIGRLYATDGTVAGTRLLWSGTTSSSFVAPVEFQGRLVQAVNSGSGVVLVTSDGTEDGTRVDVGPLAGVSVSRLWPTDGDFVGMSATGGLWRTDATPGGTFLLGQAAPWTGTQSWVPVLSPIAAPAFGGMLFARQNGSGVNAVVDLYYTDGTVEGTRIAADTLPSRVYGTVFGGRSALPGGRLFFYAKTEAEGSEPWVSDGTAAGTHLLADLRPGPSDSSGVSLGSDDGNAYFIADDGATGLELRATDGASVRTFDLTPGPAASFTASSFPSGIDAQHAAQGSGLLFAGPGGLRVCDGTDAPVIVPTGAGTYTGFKGVTAAPGGGWYAFGLLAGNAKRILALDGTAGGTRTLASFTGAVWAPFVQSGRSLFFGFGPTGQSNGLGILDLDTPDSARMLVLGNWAPTAAFRDGVLAYNSTQRAIRYISRTGDITELGPYTVPAPVVVGERVYFFGYTEGRGTELMVTDGTAEGTRVLIDLNPGMFGCSPSWIKAAGGRVYFGGLSADRTQEVWSTDGTAEGTRPAWRGDPADAPRKLVVGGPTVSGGRLYFPAERAVIGYQLHAMLLCDADLNADDFIDFDDYIRFVDAFETGSLRADVNSDGFVDFFDYSDFVTAFERGC